MLHPNISGNVDVVCLACRTHAFATSRDSGQVPHRPQRCDNWPCAAWLAYREKRVIETLTRSRDDLVKLCFRVAAAETSQPQRTLTTQRKTYTPGERG